MENKLILAFIFILLSACIMPGQKDASAQDASPLEKTPMGFLGCSNTRQTVQGYAIAEGRSFWAVDESQLHEYDGGAVLNWAKNTEKGHEQLWRVFDEYLKQNPETDTVWWQLCIRKEEAGMSYDDAVSVLNALRQRIPGVTVYVSALPEFPEHTCELTGSEGIERANELVEELVEKNSDVLTGPVIGPLYPGDIDNGDETRCHPGLGGAIMTGRQLIEFFDGGKNMPYEETDDKEMPEEPEAIEDAPEAPEDPLEAQEEPEAEPAKSGWDAISERHWENLFEKAFRKITCPEPRDPATLPDGYYKGPIIDAHIHLQSLPDGEPGLPEEEYDARNLGIGRSIDEWVCRMDTEGTMQSWVFFPVWEPITEESIKVVELAMETYPGRFIPFIMPPDDDGSPDGFPTVDAGELEAMLNLSPGLFRGYGEIGLYERPGGAAALSPDSERMMGIYKVAQEHGLVVYLHLGEGDKEALERAADTYPDVTFVFHGDQLIDCADCDRTPDAVAEILESHPNVYYGIDELYGNVWLIRPGSTKADFLEHFEDYGPLLETDMDNWKEFIESHPDQVVFDTDRGVSESWDTDPEVALTLNNCVRAFIGKLDPSVQEKLAWKNADKIFSSG